MRLVVFTAGLLFGTQAFACAMYVLPDHQDAPTIASLMDLVDEGEVVAVAEPAAEPAVEPAADLAALSELAAALEVASGPVHPIPAKAAEEPAQKGRQPKKKSS